MAELAELPTKRAAYGDDAHIEGLRAAEKLIEAKLRELGYEPISQEFIWASPAAGRRNQGATGPWRNIIVEIPGRTHPEEILIVAAHIDAVFNSPGADDDGTGAAALLEIARVLKGRPVERTVQLCFYNLEEVGLVGASAHAQVVSERIAAGEAKVIGMIALDMLGFYSTEPGSQKLPFDINIPGVTPPTTGDFIAMATILHHSPFARRLDAAMKRAEPAAKTFVFDFLPIAPPDLLRSDHAPFLAIGVPAVILTDTAEFRNSNYHRPSDTIETIDVERFTSLTRALAGAIHTLAGPVEDSGE